LVPTKEPQESTTVTPAEIIYHRRVQVLDRAGQTSVTEACRTFGISRTTYYRWAGRAQRSGWLRCYLDIFHNRTRRHSRLGMLSPIEFETRQPTTVA
jgi:hypothetical protein